MTPEQATNIVHMLRSDPLYYRNFGPFWWHVKRQLKANGFTTLALASLGDFEDADEMVTEKYAGRTIDELDDLAYETAASAAAFSRDSADYVDDETGETYRVFDEDVGV